MLPLVGALGRGDWWTWQVVYNGVVEGLAIGLIAMGIVLVYRATRVINFAVGNMGLPGSVLFPLLVINWGVPFWLALVLSLLVGVLFAVAVELTVVRRLFNSPRVVLLIATVGIATLAQAIVASYPAVSGSGSAYPVADSRTWHDVGPMGLRIKGTDLAVIIVVPLVAVGLGWLVNRTAFGKAITASAENRDLARLSGLNPRHVSTAVWAIAGFVATLSMVISSGRNGTLIGIQDLGPHTLAKALTAAVLAGMRSFPRAMAAGVAVGVVISVIGFKFFEQPGLADFVMFIAVLVAVWLQSRNDSDNAIVSFIPKIRPVPDRLRTLWWTRNLARLVLTGITGLLLLAVVLDGAIGFYEILPSRYLVWSVVASFAICAASVIVITGWAGQLSLAQMAFAGTGALTAAALHRGVRVDIGWGGTRVLDTTFPGVPFALSIIVASLVTGALAAVIGLGALRVRGLLLAATSMLFAVACQFYLFRRPILSAGSPSSVPFSRGELFGIDLDEQRSWFLTTLVALVLVLVVLGRVRRSGVGRSIIAVRDNPDGAAAYTVSPAGRKLTAFALAGAIAGFGGAILAGAVESVPYGQRFFLVDDSLRLIATAVVGGLTSVVGPVIGALWVEGLPMFFPDNALVPLFTSSLGLLFLLMYFPGGLVQLAFAARDRLFEWVDHRREPVAVDEASKPAPLAAPSAVSHRADRLLPTTVLRTEGLTVRFGGILAVDHVDLRVGRDEIVGLIGTNGAGKSTLMNAIGGYVRSTGEVELLGRSVTGTSASVRARRGIGRSFQTATLFPELTVLETVQVAFEARRRSRFLPAVLGLPEATRSERQTRSDASELISYLGLGRYAHAYISDLSTGTRRIVELAGLLALDASVLCLDEPTAGVAQREAEALGTLLVAVRRELGSSMLIVEHDMPLIMGMSDRVYCLDAGAIIASGSPAEVRGNPLVIASYLGTDERAIARSDAATDRDTDPSSDPAVERTPYPDRSTRP